MFPAFLESFLRPEAIGHPFVEHAEGYAGDGLLVVETDVL